MKYNFDETGVNFNYFLLSFLVIVLVPATFSQLFSRKNDNFTAKTKKHYVCKHFNKRQSVLTKKTLFIILGWVATAFLVQHIRDTAVESAVSWDPFDILSIPSGSTPQQIKKQYRKLSLQFHPDKVDPADKDTSESKYIEITKAYKVLTDDAARENYEKYGHPDGRQSYDMVIALPQWLVESQSSPYVLALYGLLFGILMPIYVGLWWSRSKQLTKEGLHNKTMGLYFKELKEGVHVADMIDLLTASTEYELNPGYKPADDAELPALAEKVKLEVERVSGEAFEPSTKYTGPVTWKAKVLLYAHFYRVDVGSDRYREEQQIIVIEALHLLVGVRAIVEAYNWLYPTFYAIELGQMLVQAVPQYESPLLQLPHMTREAVTEIVARKPHLTNALKLKALDEDERQQALRSLTTEDFAELEAELARIPQISLRNPTFKVVGDEIITPRAIMTFTVELTTKGPLAPITPITPKAPRPSALGDDDLDIDEEDDGVDKLINRNNPDVPEVYAPYTSVCKHSFWWLVLGDPKSNRFTVDPVRITDLSSSKSVKLQFQAPQEPGTYGLTLYIKSDAYIGSDIHSELEFVVSNAADLPYESEPDDDISEPEVDSLAGQMAQMRNQQGGPAGPDDDQTSDDE
ncbi:Sec63 Brl domain-containing protein [Dimargaris cristalligena]|uniref:Sec63 Brl domain-containing protein n=1 Tax=Dimargaris cristalligena TaxID=215637 RepID=A0A4V1J5G2_9FUNG|nr:Sec63 Brl domain-containing protein [Dimargaris cristalligena]|eukprot:RKP38949.1 Sec63 Brl domain-containing protein [Dimargaris cristalligena]